MKGTHMKTILEPSRELPIVQEADVIVIGGGPSGITAALSAARNGAKTVLVEKDGFLGGNATMGLPLFCFHDVKGNRIIEGLALEFVDRLRKRGGASQDYPCALFNSYTICDPEAVKLTAQEMLMEAEVSILLHTLTAGVVKGAGGIEAVITESKSGRQAMKSKVYVDCSGDGDVAARAGATVEKGDEQGKLQPPTLMFTLLEVDVEAARRAFTSGADRYMSLDAIPPEQIGRNRHFLGIGMTDITALAREQGEWNIPRRRVAFISTMRDDEVAVNMTRVPDVDAVDSLSLSAAELTARGQINQVVGLLRKYVPGFERARLNASSSKIGIRETRRIIGDYVLTGEDVLEGRRFADEVLLAGYFVDIHHPDREGCTNIKPKGAYGIPYGCLVPLGVDKLLVAGRCLSATHEGQAAARVMVTCMAMGEAAGCAAAMACQQNVTPRELNVGKLRERLIAQGAVLSI